MFLRRLFSLEHKAGWVLIDLIIVIIGVYTAFLIQSYSENRKLEKEKEKIMTALKFELEALRILMPGQAAYGENQANEWKSVHDTAGFANFGNWRFIEPQYNYQVLEHAISNENSEIVSFELYDALQSIYSEIKRVEYSERLLTQVSIEYTPIPGRLSKNSPEYGIIWVNNYQNFGRMILFMEDRARNQKALGEASGKALELVNKGLDPARKREIEKELIASNLHLVNSVEEAVGLALQFFPDLPSEEVRRIWEEHTSGQE